MKKIVLLASIVSMLACQETKEEPEQLPVPTQSQEQAKTKPEIAPENKEEVVIAIEGMTCAGCQHTIQQEVLKMNGVAECQVSLNDKKASVVFDKTSVTPEEIIQEIQSLEDGAYKATIASGHSATDTTATVSQSAKQVDEKQMFSHLPQFEIPNLFTFFLDLIR